MKEFAQEEIASIEAKLPQLEEDIKFMLIPADPADEKDIIVEIRAAAGGDEAAHFCRRPLQDVRALRRGPGLEDRDHGRLAVGGRPASRRSSSR